MNNYDTIGKRIKSIRRLYELNQKDFAKPLGISYGHISNIEKDKSLPSKALIKLISTEYEIEENWIQSGNDDVWKHRIEKNKPYGTGWIELDDIFCTSPPKIRQQQEKLIASIIILLKQNAILEIEKREKNLESLNNMFELMNNAVFAILSMKNNNIESAVLEDRIEILLDNVYSEFVSTLDEFSDTFWDNNEDIQ